MRQPLQLKPIRGRQLSRLRALYDQAECPRLRRRAQMVLLAQAGYRTNEIARITRQSRLTVRRWLQEIMHETQADELIAVAQIYDHTARLRSYEIGAEIFRSLV